MKILLVLTVLLMSCRSEPVACNDELKTNKRIVGLMTGNGIQFFVCDEIYASVDGSMLKRCKASSGDGKINVEPFSFDVMYNATNVIVIK